VDAKKVGKTIAFLRKRYGMTQGELADRLQVTDKAVSRWERGMGTPDISLLTKLSIILDTDIESMLEGNITHLELNWRGVVNLKYAEGIYPNTTIYGKRIIYLQLSLLMLSGINNIWIRGLQSDIDLAESILKSGENYGLHLDYEVVDECGLNYENTMDFLGKHMADCGVMLVDGLDFLYGKDLTKCFRRLLYDGINPTRLVNFEKKPTDIYFFPETVVTKQYISTLSEELLSTQVLERGIITFRLNNEDDILNAATLICILEKYQREKVYDIDDIAVHRLINPQ
jgi:transcriptional regulator with XRE-family HTH domain